MTPNINDDLDGETKEETPRPSGKGFWEKLFSAESPEKKISDYENHSLNYDHSEGMSRIIRGTEGLIGGLDRAILDIVVGVIQKVKGALKKSDAT